MNTIYIRINTGRYSCFGYILADVVKLPCRDKIGEHVEIDMEGMPEFNRVGPNEYQVVGGDGTVVVLPDLWMVEVCELEMGKPDHL